MTRVLNTPFLMIFHVTLFLKIQALTQNMLVTNVLFANILMHSTVTDNKLFNENYISKDLLKVFLYKRC